MDAQTVIVNKSFEMEQRRAAKRLETRTLIALLAATHMREMLATGWVLQSDEHGGTILVAAHTRETVQPGRPSQIVRGLVRA